MSEDQIFASSTKALERVKAILNCGNKGDLYAANQSFD